jgi:transcriptional regulator with XRE-family HTH domain
MSVSGEMLTHMTETDSRIKALILYYDASTEYAPYPHPITPTVELYPKVVKGLIEAVRLTMPDGTRAVMYVNEEGRIKGLPPNPLATALAQKLNAGFGSQVIVGNTLVVGTAGCDETNIPQTAVNIIHQLHNELRTAAGMTTRTLANGLAEQRVPMSGSGITDIERGRRGVSVDQLTALAAALGVSPIALLSPMPDDENPTAETALSGTSYETADAMYQWLRGERSLTDDMLDDYERETFRRRSNPPWTWKKKD